MLLHIATDKIVCKLGLPIDLLRTEISKSSWRKVQLPMRRHQLAVLYEVFTELIQEPSKMVSLGTMSKTYQPLSQIQSRLP